MERPANKGHSMDYGILLMITLLCGFGLVMVFSASYYYAQHFSKTNYDGFFYLKKQAVYMGLGFIAMFLVSLVPYKFFKYLYSFGYLLSVGLLVGVLLFGSTYNGARRWIEFAGQSIQPSEIAKFGMMLYMCTFMTKNHKRMKDFWKGMVPMCVVIGIVCILILLQPNMSMAVIIGMMGYALLFVGGADWKHLVFLGILLIIAFFVLAWIAPYRMVRLTTFLDPWDDGKNGLGSGYQLVQSFYALGSGGLLGKGLNNSRQKLLYMTYGESDFIFAIVGEELGFVGATVVMLCYLFIVYRGMKISIYCRDRFGSLLAAGITTVFGLQVLVNIGVVSGSMPTTGQTLPFISAGGTSLLIFMSAMGVLLNISKFADVPKTSIWQEIRMAFERPGSRRRGRVQDTKPLAEGINE